MWERAAFLLEWEASLPSTHRPDAAWLRGVALEEKVGGEDRLRYLPAEAMPLDPVERLRRLFDARKKWSLEEVAPYLRCVWMVRRVCYRLIKVKAQQSAPPIITHQHRELLPDEKGMGDFLMKHTRAALGANGERTYSVK